MSMGEILNYARPPSSLSNGITRRRSIFGAPLCHVRLEFRVGIQDFLLVIGAALIKDYVADHHQQLLALSPKPARERILAGHIH